ncbi:beta-mannosidase [Flavobacterium alkalisoli]|uniref:Beta-mannosidase n=1 Tax=Flavobacterium alkalisoli TaxID=2602769 RepID=A0A5B9FMP9_9FLAO|nr:glycosyl hydrolase [Flavobacterium alkalisoli]QEE48160.1 beta-mannosidase [Flavobacterium alkalisoli]
MKLTYRLIPVTVFFTCLIFIACSDDDKQNVTEEPIVQPQEELTVENVRSFMTDPNATDETVALFYNLYNLSKTKFLVGQQDAYTGFYNDDMGDSDMKKATGSDPALLGSDFMFITDDQNNEQPENWFYQQEILITDNVKQAYSKGMVNIFCWHFREPFEGESFYTSDLTDFQKYNALPSILPGGSNHDYYKQKLDKVADVLANLKDNNNKLIPVIFRPFHEFDGNWFWWGSAYCTPAQYQEIWRFTVEYLRDVKQVHNVLYAFSPDNSYTTSTQYLSRYPGDNYIDVLGMDNYGDFNNQGASGVATANNKLKMVSDLAISKHKIAALTETGYQINSLSSPVDHFFSDYIYSALTYSDVEVAFVMFWANSQNGYYVPPSGQQDTQDFVTFANKTESVLQNNIPDMYNLP